MPVLGTLTSHDSRFTVQVEIDSDAALVTVTVGSILKRWIPRRFSIPTSEDFQLN
jgi:hypothetical protein